MANSPPQGRKVGSGRLERLDAGVFGVALSDVCSRQNQTIPTVAEEAICYLEEHGTAPRPFSLGVLTCLIALKLEGIFRIPGNSLVVDQLKASYDGSKLLTEVWLVPNWEQKETPH